MNQPPLDEPAPSIAQQLAQARSIFVARFGRAPSFAAAAPGRVNLIGEHTDYNGGFVLPVAIDRRAIIVASPSLSDQTILVAADPGVDFAADLHSDSTPPSGFARHLVGVWREFVGRGHAVPNLELVLTSSVPIGSGLSSSAAIEVAMATILEQIAGIQLDPLDKARLCQRAEHESVGTPCGIMDMLASVAGRAGQALLIDCRSNAIRPIPMPSSRDMSLLAADTGVRRELAGSEYARRRATCESAARALGISSLRDADGDALRSAALDDEQRRSARHVIDENERVLLAAAALHTGDLAAFGSLMFQSHASLRDLFRVSCPELDCFVDAAAELRGQGGVIGARMTGAGFGGCAVVACRAKAGGSIASHIKERFAERFARTPAVFAITASDGARTIAL